VAVIIPRSVAGLPDRTRPTTPGSYTSLEVLAQLPWRGPGKQRGLSLNSTELI
jgi:hypothetical protein